MLRAFIAICRRNDIDPPIFLGFFHAENEDEVRVMIEPLARKHAPYKELIITQLIACLTMEERNSIASGGTICPRCGKPVNLSEDFVEYNDAFYHPDCFNAYVLSNLYSITGAKIHIGKEPPKYG